MKKYMEFYGFTVFDALHIRCTKLIFHIDISCTVSQKPTSLKTIQNTYSCFGIVSITGYPT